MPSHIPHPEDEDPKNPKKPKGPKATARLKELGIERFGMVNEGDNPGAHVFMSKNKEPNPPHEGDGPAIEGTGKGWMARIGAWLTKERTAKNPFAALPQTTDEIMAADQFRMDFFRLKGAFMQSIESIMDMGLTDEAATMMSQTVGEFTNGMREIASGVTKGRPEAKGELLAILESLNDAGSREDWRTAKSREDFAEALEQLEAFEPPPDNLEDELPTPKTKNFAELMAGIQDEDLKKALQEQHDAAVASATPAAPAAPAGDPPPATMPAPTEGADKAAPDAVLKRVEAAEKRAEAAEKKADVLEATAKMAGYAAKAAKLGVDGIETAIVAKAMKVIDESDDGEALLQLVEALAAKAQKGNLLLKSIGSAHDDGGGTDAEAKIEKAVTKMRDAHPDMAYHDAYSKVLELHPDLYTAYEAEASA